YGLAPDSVERLFEVMQVRLQAKALRLSTIELKAHSVVVTLDAKNKVSSQAIHRMMDRYKKRIGFLSPLSFENSRQPCKASEAVIPTPRCPRNHLPNKVSRAYDSIIERVRERRRWPTSLPAPRRHRRHFLVAHRLHATAR